MNSKTLIIFLAILSLVGMRAYQASANDKVAIEKHPVSVVEADIYVNRNRTTMRLKCFAEDLELLQGVEALDDGLYDSDELLDATQDHAKYLAEKITIRDAEGELMTPKIMEIIDIEIPDAGIKAGQLMNYTMGFVIEFKYKKSPEFITIEQNMIAEGALLPSELKVLLKQAGSDTPYMHMFKPTVPETFQFDWDNPILSKDASDQEWEEWFEDQREKNLGITSYSSVYSFIYITSHEVRHEVLIPLATLATLMEIDREDVSFLDIAEQGKAAEKIKTYFSIGNPVTIDSVEVQPVFDRVDFYGLELKDFAMQAEKRRVSMASGRVGIIMSYSTKGPPTSVEVEWDKFNNVIKTVDSVIFAYEDVEKTEFSMFAKANVFKWSEPEARPLPNITGVSSTIDVESLKAPTIKLPLLSIGLAGLAILALASRILGVETKVAATTALVCCIACVFTVNVLKREFPQPFAEKPIFEMPEEDAKQVFAQLHKNMFRAFDYHKESDVYDALSKSVDGELLRKLYLNINSSLKVAEQGGAVSRVKEVNLLDGNKSREWITETDESPAFTYRSKWNLVGTIEHWGHIHERTNEYEAEFEIQLRDDAWKITSLDVKDEKQGKIKQSLRTY